MVGPAGIYLLESKNLQGIVGIKHGVPRLARRHDPDKTETFGRIRPRALADAKRLKEDVERRTGHRIWVHAVIVFWSEFPEGFVQDGKCVFVEGSRLRGWLQSRPRQLSPTDAEEIAAGIASIAAGEPAGVPVPTG